MTTLKPRHVAADVLAALAWAAMALTPVGWFYGGLAVAYSHLGDVTDVSMMTGGIALFVTPPTSAFILAVYAARAGHRSGKIAVVVSGLVLLATLAFSAWQTGGWINVAVIAVMAVVAVLVFVWVRSRNKPPPPVGWERVKTSRGSSRGSAHPEPGGRPNHRPA